VSSIISELYQAICRGDRAAVEAMVAADPALLGVRLPGNATPLLAAAERAHADMAGDLLRLGAKLDLPAAVALGRTEALRALLDEDPRRVRKCFPEGWPLLHMAARFGGPETIELLLACGAGVNDRDRRYGRTALFFAWKLPNAEALLEHGADIRARDKENCTVLHYACAGGSAEWVDFLLRHGADSAVQSRARQTAWALAVRYGRREIAARIP
jgi:ankyrin repeat protein